jgi:glutathionylspermidine synthase
VRALFADPAELPPARYRRFLRRAQMAGLLADHLVAGEPYLALNALVLSPGEDALLRHLTTAFAAAFQAGGEALRPDVPALIDLGFPWLAAELLAAEPARVPLVGRFDFARDRDGRWWLLEYNADTPSGLRETVVADRLVHELLPLARCLDDPSRCLAGRLIDAFEQAVPAGRALGLVTSAGELEDLCQTAFLGELLRERLAARGVEVVVGDARDLGASGGRLRLGRRRLGSLYRLLPFESALGSPPFAAMLEAALAGRVALLNGLYGLLLQHKGLMAWLWQHRDDAALPDDARAAVSGHLPPTWRIDEVPPSEPRATLVAKQVFGREGEEVHFGSDLSEPDWAELRRRRTYVAQRRVAVAELEAAVPTSVGATRWRGGATLGAFTVDGRWAGYYARFGGRLTTNRSKWLATLVG